MRGITKLEARKGIEKGMKKIEKEKIALTLEELYVAWRRFDVEWREPVDREQRFRDRVWRGDAFFFFSFFGFGWERGEMRHASILQ